MTFLQYRLVIPLWKAKSMCIMGAPTNHTPTNRPHTQHPYSNRPRHYPYLHNWSPKNPSLSHTIPCLNGDGLYQGRSVRGRFRKGRFFFEGTVCGDQPRNSLHIYVVFRSTPVSKYTPTLQYLQENTTLTTLFVSGLPHWSMETLCTMPIFYIPFHFTKSEK